MTVPETGHTEPGDPASPDRLAGREAWLGQPSYWLPKHLQPVSAWWEHAPFASWLVSTLRPRVYAELGTHYGFSYFAVCDAVRRLGLPTRAFAVDSWQGDDQAGFYDDAVYDFVRQVNESDYAGFSTLLRGWFSDQLGSFAEGSIDLLHIDGRHGYEDVKEDFESWLPKVSERGVVIFHDVAEHQEGFGVWRFWAELEERYPDAFAFEHGHGLGVLGVGSRPDASMRAFFDVARERPEEIRAVYAALGARIGHVAAQESQVQQLSVQSQLLQQRLGQLMATSETLREQYLHVAQQLQQAETALGARL